MHSKQASSNEQVVKPFEAGNFQHGACTSKRSIQGFPDYRHLSTVSLKSSQRAAAQTRFHLVAGSRALGISSLLVFEVPALCESLHELSR